MKRIVRCRTGQQSLLRTLFDGPSLDHSKAIQHGKKNESVAVEAYKAFKLRQRRPVDVRPCGIALHLQYRYIGASPDGMVRDPSAHPKYGLLEVKCPHAKFGSSTEEAAGDKGFCLAMIDGCPQLDPSHAYYFQVQGQLGVCNLQWCDFVVWLGDSVHVERIVFDRSFWRQSMLPSLLSFYLQHAVPYLLERKRPTPVSFEQKAPAAEAAPTPPVCSGVTTTAACHVFAECEVMLASNLSQYTIDGRNGSNACTVIACLFMKHVLDSGGQDLSKDAMCKAMREGNNLYDTLGVNVLLSTDEALQIESLHLAMCGEIFVRPSKEEYQGLIDSMYLSAQVAPSGVCGGIFVTTPFSFSLFCFAATERFVLFDSHSHGNAGALLADVPLAAAAEYLIFFFDKHYPQLRFNESHPGSPMAHVSFLKVQ